MSIMKMIICGTILFSMASVIYVIVDVCIKRHKLNKREINNISNNKYIIIIIILFVLFVLYGILRNFM